MKGRSKILAGSSILAFLAVGGGGAALGLAYYGELFALLPALSSIGMSTIGPVLIGATALFFSISLILSISFLRSRGLEKKSNKKEDLTKEDEIDLQILIEEQEKIRNFSDEDKERYFKDAIKNFDRLAINAIVKERESCNCFNLYYAAKGGGSGLLKYIKELGETLMNHRVLSMHILPFMTSLNQMT